MRPEEGKYWNNTYSGNNQWNNQWLGDIVITRNTNTISRHSLNTNLFLVTQSGHDSRHCSIIRHDTYMHYTVIWHLIFLWHISLITYFNVVWLILRCPHLRGPICALRPSSSAPQTSQWPNQLRWFIHSCRSFTSISLCPQRRSWEALLLSSHQAGGTAHTQEERYDGGCLSQAVTDWFEWQDCCQCLDLFYKCILIKGDGCRIWGW